MRQFALNWLKLTLGKLMMQKFLGYHLKILSHHMFSISTDSHKFSGANTYDDVYSTIGNNLHTRKRSGESRGVIKILSNFYNGVFSKNS